MVYCGKCKGMFDHMELVHGDDCDYCPHCGNDNLYDAEICELCGEPMPPFSRRNRYCDYCDECYNNLVENIAADLANLATSESEKELLIDILTLNIDEIIELISKHVSERGKAA